MRALTCKPAFTVRRACLYICLITGRFHVGPIQMSIHMSVRTSVRTCLYPGRCGGAAAAGCQVWRVTVARQQAAAEQDTDHAQPSVRHTSTAHVHVHPYTLVYTCLHTRPSKIPIMCSPSFVCTDMRAGMCAGMYRSAAAMSLIQDGSHKHMCAIDMRYRHAW